MRVFSINGSNYNAYSNFVMFGDKYYDITKVVSIAPVFVKGPQNGRDGSAVVASILTMVDGSTVIINEAAGLVAQAISDWR